MREVTEQARKNLPPDTSKPIGESVSAVASRFVRGPIDHEEIRRQREERDRQERETASRHRRDTFIAGFGKRYTDCSLESFECHGAPEERKRQGAVLDQLREFQSELKLNLTEGRGLLLFGPPGTGKDHLMFALLIRAFDMGATVKWLNGMDFFAEMRDRISDERSEVDMAKALAEPAVLAISDPMPPRGAVSDFQASLLFRIIDRRYRDSKCVWVTMNVKDSEECAERMGASNMDRLRDNSLKLFCNWPSYRAK